MDMRSKIFASTLAIGLGLAAPVVSAIGFSEISVAQTVNDQMAEASKLLKEGDSNLDSNKNDVALPLLEKALKLYQDLKDRAGEGQALKSLGNAYLGLKQYDKALALFQQSLSIAQEIKNQDLEARSLNNVGQSYEFLKRSEEAIVSYKKSLVISKSSQNWEIFEKTAINLGNLYQQVQRYGDSLTTYHQSELIFRQIKDKSKEARAIALIGDSYLHQENYAQALKFYNKARMIAKEGKDKFREHQIISVSASIYFRQEKYDSAIKLYQEALTISRDLNNPDLVLPVTTAIALAYQKLNNLSKSIEYYQQLLTDARKVKKQPFEVFALQQLSQVYITLKLPKKVIEFSEPGLSISKELNDVNSEAVFSAYLTAGYDKTGQTQKGITLSQRTIDLIDKLTPQYKSEVLINIARLYLKDSRDQEAIDLLQILNSTEVDGKKIPRDEARKQAEIFLGVLKDVLRNESTQESAISIPNDIDIIFHKAYVQLMSGESRTAIKTINNVLEANRLSSNSVLKGKAYNLLSRAYYELGKNQDAIEYSKKAIEAARLANNSEIEGFGIIWQSIALSDSDEKTAFKLAQSVLEKSRVIKNRKLEAWANYASSIASEGEQSVSFAQEMLSIANELKDWDLQGWANLGLTTAYITAENSQEAEKSSQEVLKIAEKINNRFLEGRAYTLNSIISSAENNSQATFEASAKAIIISDELNNPSIRALSFLALSQLYNKQNDYEKVIEFSSKLLEITEDNHKYSKINYLGLLLLVQSNLEVKKYAEAIRNARKIVDYSRSQNNFAYESVGLASLGKSYAAKGEIKLADQLLRNSEEIAQKITDSRKKVESLSFIRTIYEDLNNATKITQLNQELLDIARIEKNPELLFIVLNYLSASEIRSSGNFREIGKWLDEYVKLIKETKKYDVNKVTLIIFYYFLIEDYRKMEDAGKTYLYLARKSNNRKQELGALALLSGIYWLTQDKGQSESLLKTDLVKFVEGTSNDEKAASSFISFIIFNTLEDHEKVIQSSELFIEFLPKLENLESQENRFMLPIITDVIRVFTTPSYAKAKRSQEAIRILKDSISKLDKWTPLLASFSQEKENPSNTIKALLLVHIAETYYKDENLELASIFYQKALSLPIMKSVDNNQYTGYRTIAYVGLGNVYEKQNHPVTAVSYYKKAVDELDKQRTNFSSEITKTISQQLISVPTSKQMTSVAAANFQSLFNNLFMRGYIGDFNGSKNSDVYRKLADLLIEQGRISEAQQVLELLKIQELNDFTQTTRTAIPRTDLGFTPTEQTIQIEHNKIIAFGIILDKCRNEDCKTLKQQEAEYDRLRNTFLQFIQNLEAETKKNEETGIAIRTSDFTKSADKLANRPNTALIYPLVLKDKVRLLWMAQGKVSGSATCNLPKKQLNEHVTAFRTLISQSSSDLRTLKAEGKALYDCLIKPLAPAFAANRITNLIFIPDLNTSYIPLAALHDGTDYLAKTYTISNALSAELTNADDRLPAPSATNILGLGLTDAFPNYNALPNVQLELDSIIQTLPAQGIYPGTTFLNGQFTRETLTGKNQKNLRDRKIIHIATHGEFLPTDPKSSYLLLGNGEKFPIYQIQDLDALRNNTHLVVLSACKTGVMGTDSNGIEIGGINSYFLRDRAKAVLASLWNVDDGSTSLLMQNFYLNLSTGMSKPEALRQAQLNLLNQTITPKTASERGFRIYRPPGSTAPYFAHPYFWAAFTLTGNPN